MDRSKFCGCKGVRSCLLCEEKYSLQNKQNHITSSLKDLISYVYCMFCDKIYQGWDENEYLNHPYHNENGIGAISGLLVVLNFISDEEEANLLNTIDNIPWTTSQSGRRKQNFGPNCNFKKKKLKPGSFKGFPIKTEFVQKKFQTIPLLNGYQTIEQCTLEYDPSRGASIDPHIDDCWIWGERIITVNLLSSTVLTLTRYKGDKTRYNLNCASEISSEAADICIRIPMPSKSLVVLFGDARYNWEHCILRGDIRERRLCLAYREFTSPYLPGGEYEKQGELILKLAKEFWP